MRKELQSVVDELTAQGHQVTVNRVENEHNDYSEKMFVDVEGVEFNVEYDDGAYEHEEKSEIWAVRSTDDALNVPVNVAYDNVDGVVDIISYALDE